MTEKIVINDDLIEKLNAAISERKIITILRINCSVLFIKPSDDFNIVFENKKGFISMTVKSKNSEVYEQIDWYEIGAIFINEHMIYELPDVDKLKKIRLVFQYK